MLLDYTIVRQSRYLYDSYNRLAKEPLIEGSFASDQDLANAMYTCSKVILSHDLQDDPVFNYANEAAQILWGMSWDEFVRLPSRFSVEPIGLEERKVMLEEARKIGFITNIDGIRISRTGRRFKIRNATLWNVVDDDETYLGQAAMFETWEFMIKKADVPSP